MKPIFRFTIRRRAAPLVRSVGSAGSIVSRVLLGLAFFAAGVARGGEAAVSREYQLKAAFLFNFTKFIEWPPARFSTPDAPVAIGILGRNPFGAELEKIVAGRQVNGRPIAVRFIESGGDAAAVHLLFVPAGEEQRPELAAAFAARAGVVTVGESTRFAALGGMIAFVSEADRIRFAIDLEAAERAGVKLSAQLLKLASSVRRKS